MKLQLENYSNYRSFLSDILEERCRRNPTYSLRAFSKSIGISPSMLSSILKKQKNLSQSRASQVATSLKLSEIERVLFLEMVQVEFEKNHTAQLSSQSRLNHLRDALHTLNQHKDKTPVVFHQLELDVFEMISHWYYFAILDYSDLTGSSSDVFEIAERLDITIGTVREAMKRLGRLGLLKIENGRLIKTNKEITTTKDIPSQAIRQCTGELLDKAKVALESQDVALRDFSAITVAVDTGRIPEIKDKIEVFRRSLCQSLGESTQKNGLYCLSIQLFSLMKENS